MFISYATPAADPIAAIKGYLQAGYNGGAWNGTPTASTGVITSLKAAANPTASSVGYADYGDGMNVNTTFNTVELKYTAIGDSDLDGTVGLPDYNAVVRNFGTGTTWDRGVVSYDGTVSLADYNAVVRNFGNTAPAAAAAIAAVSAAPAPPSADAGSAAGSSPRLLPAIDATTSTHPPAHHVHATKGSRKRK